MRILSFFLALAAVYGLSLFSIENSNTKKNSPMGFGDPDDPHSLYAWNLLRMADPSTGTIPNNIRTLELEFASTLPVNYNRSISWDLVGPRDLGGRTRAVAFDVRNDSIIIAGGVSGGIWKSMNGGQSFYKVTQPAQLHSITSVVQDTRVGHEDTWYAGTGEYYTVVSVAAFSAPFSGNGIFKSTDNGETWTLLSSTASGTPQNAYVNGDMDYVWRVVTDHTNTTQDVVLAAVFNGVYRSEDGGTSWTPVLGLDTSLASASDWVDLIQTSSGIFYAVLSSDGPDKGIYRSDDGINWTAITPASGFPGTYRRCVLCYNPQNDNEIMLLGETPSAGTNGHSLWKYTYLSGNGSGAGGQWINRSNKMPTYSCTGFYDFDFGKFNSQGGYDLCIAWHPADDSVIFLGGTNIYRSNNQFTDTGSKWIGGYRCYAPDLSDYVYPNHHPDQHGMIFYPSNPNRMLSFNDGGLYYSENLMDTVVNWTPLNHHYITSQFYTVAMEQGDANSDYLTCGAQDNGTWFTNANHLDSLWKWVCRGDGSFCAIPNGRDYYLMSIQQGKIYKTDINHVGDTTLNTRIDPNVNETSQFINPFILDPLDNNKLYMVQNLRIMRHLNVDQIPLTGQNYDTLNQGWSIVPSSGLTFSDQSISAIEMSAAAPDVIFYGSSKGRVYKLTGASQTTATRVNISSSLFPANCYVSSISVNPFDANDILVAFSNYRIRSLFHSKDGGVTWKVVSGNLEQFPDGSGNGPACYWVETYPSWPTPTYFVGTSTGLYSATALDTNTIWVQEGAGTIGNVNVNMVVARSYDGKIAVATHGNGIYTGYMTPAFLHTNDHPTESFFMQVYPNPAEENAVVQFTVPTLAAVRMELYDLQGRKVHEQEKGTLPPGRYEIQLVGTEQRITPGTYLVAVYQNQKKTVRKWIVK